MNNDLAILSIGREIMLGHVVDTNASFVCRAAGALGYRVARVLAVDDAEADIVAAMRELAATSRFVVVTGGLGPTPDDLTRAAAAKAAGVELIYHEELWQTVLERFRSFGSTPTESNRVQAYLPAGAAAIANPLGTAPGFDMKIGGARLFAMPGVPLEMKRMFADHVLPALRAAASSVRYMKQFHICGLGESLAGEMIAACQPLSPQADIGTCVDNALCVVRVMAYGPTAAEAEAKAAAARDALREKLAPWIYAEDGESLSAVTLQALARRGRTLALAESCTGGLIAAALVDHDGASAVLKEGIVCYSNEAKMRLCGVSAETLARHGAVSEETVRALAENVRARAGADYGLSVSGVAGPGGGTPEKPVGTVWLAASGPRGTATECRHFTGDRNGNRERARNAGLYLLLKQVLADQVGE